MKKKLIILTLTGILSFGLVGCNNITKNFGGEMTFTLHENKKLVNVTWKDSSLWYLTKDMKESDVCETYEFVQKRNTGVMQGKVIIKEVKNDNTTIE